MRRFIAMSLGLLLLVVHIDGRAEDTGVGVATLVPGPPSCPQTSPVRTAFERTIRQAGFDRVSFTRVCYAELAEIPARLSQVLATKPSVVVIWGSAVAARMVAESTGTVPVVFGDIPDPVENGLVASLAHPGGHVTGISSSDEELVAKRVELLKEAVPGLTRLAVLANTSNPNQLRYAEVAKQAARSLKIEARVYPVERPPQLARSFAEMAADGNQAIVLLPDAWFYPQRAEIVSIAAGYRVPVMYTNTAYPDLGGLLTYASDLVAMGEKVGGYVAKILKGAKASELPVERAATIEYIVNTRTAREQGISLPAATLMRATRVIE
jgi:putative ABC transport system substrate-binding protein